MKNKIYFLGMVFSLLLVNSCQKNAPLPPAAQGAWIKGTEAKKLKTIEKQFRGFDKAMVEVGYRYQEMFWAGQDLNWEYAKYHVKKIRKAIEYGLERRPKRAESAQHFLNDVLPEMEKSIDNKDKVAFDKDFENLTKNCNQCHSMNDKASFTVKTPLRRVSPIRSN